MINTPGRYWRTIRHLKPVQIRYRLWYALRDLGTAAGPKLRLPDGVAGEEVPRGATPNLEEGITPDTSSVTAGEGSTAGTPREITFTLLNRSHTFREGIDWDFKDYGVLWAYNLNYHGFLREPAVSPGLALELIRDYIDKLPSLHTGTQPYPISLRGVNWIFFITRHGIDGPRVDAALHAQYRLLARSPEYHLLGNHLLENACSLLFGAYYFKEEKWLEQAEEILTEQVSEQVLRDGGHFERSTMYHAILLERLLDCHNLMSRNPDRFGEGRTDRLGRQVKNACGRMLGWMEQIWTESGRMPLLNDAARGVAPTRQALRDYAARLGVSTEKRPLSDSGYRRYREGPLELLADVGDIGPDYIPGHAHADTLSFVLDAWGEPAIIDPGVSTYEESKARQRERSTAFHNTVMVDRTEQSEIWSAFRVGRRAKIIRVKERGEKGLGSGPKAGHRAIRLIASHNGYRRLGVTHRRVWEIGPSSILITDTLKAGEKTGVAQAHTGTGEHDARAFLHFAPGLEPERTDVQGEHEYALRVTLPDAGRALAITFRNARSVELEKYSCPDGYNRYLQAVKAVVTFSNRLETRISPSE